MSLDQIVECISKPPTERNDDELNELVPWFLMKCPLKIKPDVAKDILRNCEFKESPRDDVIIRQGDLGDCFYICLTGKVSIYINTEAVPDDPSEAQVVAGENEAGASEEKKELDRNKYGKYIVSFGDGRSFGELALINKDCVRNASIISDERTLLIVVNRALYNRSLKAVQEAEFKERIDYVSKCSIFHNWIPKYKRQAAMSLRKELYQYEAVIAKQGEPLNGLYFILNGQAKVVVDIIQHYSQYPQLQLHDSPEEQQQKEAIGKIMEQSGDDKTPRSSSSSQQQQQQQQPQLWDKPLRRQGYAAAEFRQWQKHLEISLIGPGEMVGDIEHGMELPTYAQSVICTQPTEVFVLDAKNFERLVMNKRNQVQTMDMLASKAETKLMSRVTRALDRQVPLIRSLCHRIVEQHRAEEQRRRQRSERLGGDFEVKDADVSHFIPSRGPLIDPFGPGTVFYRNKVKRQRKLAAQKAKLLKAGSSAVAAVASAVHLQQQQQMQQQQQQQQLDEEEDEFYHNRQQDQFADFDTSSEHLSDLERRIGKWFDNVDQTKRGAKVVQMPRFHKEADQKIHPGKKVYMRPKQQPFRLIGSAEAGNDEWGYKSEEEIFITAQAEMRSRIGSRSTQRHRHSAQNHHDSEEEESDHDAEALAPTRTAAAATGIDEAAISSSSIKRPQLHSGRIQGAEAAAAKKRSATGNVPQFAAGVAAARGSSSSSAISSSSSSGIDQVARAAAASRAAATLPADARTDPVGFSVSEHLTAAERRQNTAAVLKDILNHQMLPDDVRDTLRDLERMSSVLPDLDDTDCGWRGGKQQQQQHQRQGRSFRARSILLPAQCVRCRKRNLTYNL